MMMMMSKSTIFSLLLATSASATPLRATTTMDQTPLTQQQPRKMKEIQSLVRQGQQQRHHLAQRKLQDFEFGFAEICEFFKGIFEAAEFTCTCNTDTNTLSCTSAEICNDDETNATTECGVMKLELDFTSDDGSDELTLDYTKVCFEFLRDAAEEYPDICIRLNADETGQDIESCEIEVENATGTLTKCSKCELCTTNNEDGFHLDCSNIYASAKTDGCVAEGGDDAESDLSTNTSQENPIRIVQQRAAATADNKNQGSPAATPTAGSSDTSAATPLRWMTPVGLVVVVLGTVLGF